MPFVSSSGMCVRENSSHNLIVSALCSVETLDNGKIVRVVPVKVNGNTMTSTIEKVCMHVCVNFLYLIHAPFANMYLYIYIHMQKSCLMQQSKNTTTSDMSLLHACDRC
jgi:hypothetical protein